MKKKNDINKLENLQKKVKKFTKDIPLNNQTICKNTYNNFHLDSWLNNHEQNIITNNNILNIDKGEINTNNNKKTQKINIIFNNDQKLKISNWFEACRIMYNKTLQYIKNYKNDHKNDEKFNYNFKKILNYKHLRTYHLKNFKKNLENKYKLPSHVLVGAIKLVCTNYKSALTNLKNGNIKHFRIRYLKKNKKSHIFDIEKDSFHKKGFFKRFLGNIQNTNNFNYSDVTCDSQLYYNSDTKRYTLLVPESIEDNTLENRNKDYISIDPGERTFLTCLTKNKIIECGTNIKKKINNTLDKIKNIKNNKNTYFTDKKKKIKERKIEKKLKNQMEDAHWKLINYLVKNYKHIIIGKWSTKSCVNNTTSVLKGTDKNIILRLNYYKFKERLKYKCNINKSNLIISDEYHTTQVCSNCTNQKTDVGGNKIYNCNKCNFVFDRDVNSCKNILCLNLH